MKAMKEFKQFYSADDHRVSLPVQAGNHDSLLTHNFDKKERELYNEEYKKKTEFKYHGSGHI